MKYQIVSRDRVFNGFYKMDKFVFTHDLFTGGTSPEITRELMIRPDAVCVLLFDPVLDQVVLVEQFRIGGLSQDNPWLLELVAGLIDKDESPEEVGRREAVEEAGIELGRMKQISKYLPSPGGSNEEVYLFIAEVDSSNAGGVFGLEHEGEDIRVAVMSVDDAWHQVQKGRMNNAAGIMAMQWLQLNYDQIKQEWSS